MKYVVYLTRYKGTKLPPWYIGSSYEEKVKDGYNGSVLSKKYKEIYRKEQNENKHLFKTRILSYHETREEATKEELRLQKLHKVVPSNNYFNESYATINGMFGRDVSGELHPMYGKTHAKESMVKMIETSKNDIDEKGINLLTRKAVKGSITMKKVGPDGKTTYQKSGEKQSKTKMSRTRRFDVFRNDILIHEFISRADMVKISSALFYTNKEKPLGSTRQSKIELNKYSKLHLMGMYAVERDRNDTN